MFPDTFNIGAHQVQGTSRVLLLIGVLDEEEQTLSGLTRPSNNRVSDLGLLATEVLAQVVRCDRLLAEPEILLGEAEGAGIVVSTGSEVSRTIDLLLQTRCLVAENTAVDRLDHLLLLLFYGRDSFTLSFGHIFGNGCLHNRRGDIVASNNGGGRGLNGADLGQIDGLGSVDGRHSVYFCLGSWCS
jgi:hypothetical protein